MRISDWSSDVCSSDLTELGPRTVGLPLAIRAGITTPAPQMRSFGSDRAVISSFTAASINGRITAGDGRKTRSEERRVGNECVVRVDLGGRRIIERKKTNKRTQLTKNKK